MKFYIIQNKKDNLKNIPNSIFLFKSKDKKLDNARK